MWMAIFGYNSDLLNKLLLSKGLWMLVCFPFPWITLEATYLENGICLTVLLRTVFLKYSLFLHFSLAPMWAWGYLKGSHNSWQLRINMLFRTLGRGDIFARLWVKDPERGGAGGGPGTLGCQHPQWDPSWGQGNREPHALLCWETRREFQPTGGTAVMDAKVEDPVESQEALWDNEDT